MPVAVAVDSGAWWTLFFYDLLSLFRERGVAEAAGLGIFAAVGWRSGYSLQSGGDRDIRL